MRLTHTFLNSLISRRNTLALIVSILAVSGTTTELLGGIWDATSHIMREPEKFWTIQHVVVYAGVLVTVCSALVGIILCITKCKNKTLLKGIKIIILGSILQLSGGYADSESHEIYGVDGLVTPSHLVIETGLLLSAVGGYVTLFQLERNLSTKIVSISVMTCILASMWIGFNLILLVGPVILCAPIYEMFSSGCAVL